MTGERKKLAELKNQLLIDKFELDSNIAEQPTLYNEAGDLAAKAASIRDEAKKIAEEIYAEISLAIREEAKSSGIKTTEDGIKQQVTMSSEYQEAMSGYLKAKQFAEECQILKEAYHQRGYMLRDMASLWIGGYFAEVSVKTQDVEETRHNMARNRLATERERRKNGN